MSREVVDGQDLSEVMAAMERAVVRARRPAAPTLLEIRTYRFVGHSMSDPIHGHYRTKEEVETHRKRDPIHLWAERLKAENLIDDETMAQMDSEVTAEALDAYEFADASPDPEPEELWTDVYTSTAGVGGQASGVSDVEPGRGAGSQPDA
jgi:pyruvate dehydrogenase E1 component alpha subunit